MGPAFIESFLKKAAQMKKEKRKTKRIKKWSATVTKNSNALDLEENVFTKEDPHEIALSLKRSANKSHRRKGTPYQSAMSMLSFYINRAGKNLSNQQKEKLEKSKEELKKVFNRE